MTAPQLPQMSTPGGPPAGGPVFAQALFGMADGATPPPARINAVIYGNSGVGKTAMVTALPWGTERWGDKAVYVAWDAGSETLLSVQPEDRSHLVVVTPKYQVKGGPGEPQRMVMNPYKAAMHIATADWAALVPGARTLIWDGGTRLAEQILRAVANTGATVSPSKKEKGEETRLGLGDKDDPSYLALPIIPDYGMAQHAIMQWSEFLRQQPLNVLVVCVSDYYKPEGGSLESDTVGGPATVGVKIIPKFMKDWDNVWRMSLEVDTVMVEPAEKGKPVSFQRVNKRVLRTEKEGIWDSKIRRPAGGVNTLAKYEASNNWRDFWEKFDASGLGKEQ